MDAKLSQQREGRGKVCLRYVQSWDGNARTIGFDRPLYHSAHWKSDVRSHLGHSAIWRICHAKAMDHTVHPTTRVPDYLPDSIEPFSQVWSTSKHYFQH